MEISEKLKNALLSSATGHANEFIFETEDKDLGKELLAWYKNVRDDYFKKKIAKSSVTIDLGNVFGIMIIDLEVAYGTAIYTATFCFDHFKIPIGFKLIAPTIKIEKNTVTLKKLRVLPLPPKIIKTDVYFPGMPEFLLE